MKFLAKRVRLGIVLLAALMLTVLFSGTAAAQTRYIVKSGDTLSSIAWTFGVPMACIANANGIADTSRLQAGRSLYIPDAAECGTSMWGIGGGPQNVNYYPGYPYNPPTYYPAYSYYYHPAYYPPAGYRSDCYHRVAIGENLFRIALRYGTSYWALAQANGLYNPNYIYAGQILRIPGCN